MKRIFAALLSLAVLVTCASCGTKRESAQTVVEKAITAVQNLDVEAMERYWGAGEFQDVNGEEADEESLAIMSLIVKNLQYNIVGATEEGKNATVTVEFTNTDMSAILSELLSAALTEMFSYAFLPEDQQPSDEELNAMFMEMLTELMNREGNPTVTNQVNIDLTLVGNQWQIVANDDVVDAMLGGMSSFTESMDDAFSGEPAADETGELSTENESNQ